MTQSSSTKPYSDQGLREALERLAYNVGALKFAEAEIRASVGNTNWQRLMDALADADVALEETGA